MLRMENLHPHNAQYNLFTQTKCKIVCSEKDWLCHERERGGAWVAKASRRVYTVCFLSPAKQSNLLRIKHYSGQLCLLIQNENEYDDISNFELCYSTGRCTWNSLCVVYVCLSVQYDSQSMVVCLLHRNAPIIHNRWIEGREKEKNVIMDIHALCAWPIFVLIRMLDSMQIVRKCRNGSFFFLLLCWRYFVLHKCHEIVFSSACHKNKWFGYIFFSPLELVYATKNEERRKEKKIP